jgi:hypothetical protein
MPEKETIERAREDAREGKAPSTQAGEFVREEFDHVREGRHGVRNTKQAIAIGLSKARRAGVKLPPPGKRSASRNHTTGGKSKAGSKSSRSGHSGSSRSTITSPKSSQLSRRRSRATTNALKKEGRVGASRRAVARQGKEVAHRRSQASRSQAGKKGAQTRKRISRSATGSRKSSAAK